jgi:putative membrane protein
MSLPRDFVEAWLEFTVLGHVDGAIGGPREWGELLRAWTFDPLVLVLLCGTGWAYRRGARHLRSQVGPTRGLRPWEVTCFWIGWWTLVLALVTPLHAWGQVLFSAHMTQHELLMLVAAPLLVLGRPVVAWMFALPVADARQVSRIARVPAVRRSWQVLTHPFVAWAVHAVALWTWHVPAFFQATLTSELVHDLQHASFFGSALLFWWAVVHIGPGTVGYGAAILYLFTTMVHSGLLGALLTFAERLVYPAYQYTAPDWSLTALEDQQLGGVIMWVPAGLVYIVAALALLAGWMRTAERRSGRAPLA